MRRNTRLQGDWSSDVCSSDLPDRAPARGQDVAVLVEHDHGLATLLEQHLAAHRIWIHHSVTTPSPRVSTFRRSEERRVGKEGRARWTSRTYQQDSRKRGWTCG